MTNYTEDLMALIHSQNKRIQELEAIIAESKIASSKTRNEEDSLQCVRDYYNNLSEIDRSELSNRSKNLFKKVGVRTFAEISKYTRDRLYNIAGLGDNTYCEIISALQKRNLTLTPSSKSNQWAPNSISEDELRRRWEGKASKCPLFWYERRKLTPTQWAMDCYNKFIKFKNDQNKTLRSAIKKFNDDLSKESQSGIITDPEIDQFQVALT